MEKKRKGIALKTSSSKENHKEDSSDDQDAENLNLIVKKFGKFLKRSKDKKFSKPSKKVKNNNTFEWRKQGHIKSDFPVYLKKQLAKKKRKKDGKPKKAYIACIGKEE